jgi:hypothetical protein
MNPQQLLEQPYYTATSTPTSFTTSMIEQQQQHFVVTQQAYHQLQTQPYQTIDFRYETPHIQPVMTTSSDLSNYTTSSNNQIPFVSMLHILS